MLCFIFALQLPFCLQGVDVEYVEVMSTTPSSLDVRRRDEPVVYSSLAPHTYSAHVTEMDVNPMDYGHESSECRVPTTTSLHDMAGVVHPARGHHSSSMHDSRREGVNVYGTIRRGDRTRESSSSPHPRAVSTFLATSHQESAV